MDKYEAAAREAILRVLGSDAKGCVLSWYVEPVASILRQHFPESPEPEILDAPDSPGLWWCEVETDPNIIACKCCLHGADENVQAYAYYCKRVYAYALETIEPFPGRYQRVSEAIWPEPKCSCGKLLPDSFTFEVDGVRYVAKIEEGE